MKTLLSAGVKTCNAFNDALEAKLKSNTVAILSIITLSVLSLWIDGRPFYIDSYIGHADQAEVANVTQNILEGNGAVTDSVWVLYGGGREGIPQKLGYWSLYLAIYQLPFFYLLGPTRQAVLIAASAAKLFSGFSAAYLVNRITRRRLPALLCLFGVCFTFYMEDRVNGYSDISLCAALTLAGMFLCIGIESQRYTSWGLAGLFGGFATGLKPSGLLSLGLILGFSLLPRSKTISLSKKIKQTGIALISFALAITPLCLYNYEAGGSIWWADATVVRDAVETARQLDKPMTIGLYAPDLPSAMNLELAQGKQLRSIKAENIKGNWKMIGALAISLALLFFTHRAWLKHFAKTTSLPTQPKFVAAYLATLLIFAGFLLAVMVHYESRYWCFIFPMYLAWLYIAVIAANPRLLTFSLIVTFVFAFQAYRSSQWSNDVTYKPHHHKHVDEHHHPYLEIYRKVDKLIPKDAIVMNADPWEFAFHTRRRCVAIPYTDNDATFIRVINRYAVTHLILHNNSRHPRTKKWQSGNPPVFLELAHKEEGLAIFRVRNKDARSPGSTESSKTFTLSEKTGVSSVGILSETHL